MTVLLTSETHPYIKVGETPRATKLILGSFPIYECSDPDDDEKRLTRELEGTIRFFYGSCSNSFWHYYSEFVDATITPPWNSSAILESVKARRIAISDTILSCQRKNRSSNDSDLVRCKWNRLGVSRIINNGVSKILCTSKGVLDQLQKNILCPAKKPLGYFNKRQTSAFQDEWLTETGGESQLLKHSVVRVFQIGGRTVKAIALPSPGSPQRKIKDFGYDGVYNLEHARLYFQAAFAWLIK